MRFLFEGTKTSKNQIVLMLHISGNILKNTKLYTLNGWITCYVNYISTKLFLKKDLVQDPEQKKEHVNKYFHPTASRVWRKSNDSAVISHGYKVTRLLCLANMHEITNPNESCPPRSIYLNDALSQNVALRVSIILCLCSDSSFYLQHFCYHIFKCSNPT